MQSFIKKAAQRALLLVLVGASGQVLSADTQEEALGELVAELPPELTVPIGDLATSAGGPQTLRGARLEALDVIIQNLPLPQRTFRFEPAVIRADELQFNPRDNRIACLVSVGMPAKRLLIMQENGTTTLVQREATDACWINDGRDIVVSPYQRQSPITVYNATTLEEKFHIPKHYHYSAYVTWNAVHSRLVVASDQEIDGWRIDNEGVTVTYQGHYFGARPTRTSLSNDGSTLAVLGMRSGLIYLTLHRITERVPALFYDQLFPQTHYLTGCPQWSTDDSQLLYVSGGREADAGSAAYDTERAKNRLPTIWSTITGQIEKSFIGHTDTVTNVQWCPTNNDFIASGSEDGTVKIWRTSDGVLLKNIVYGAPVTALDWHKNGKTIAVALRGGIVHLLDIGSWMEQLKILQKVTPHELSLLFSINKRLRGGRVAVVSDAEKKMIQDHEKLLPLLRPFITARNTMSPKERRVFEQGKEMLKVVAPLLEGEQIEVLMEHRKLIQEAMRLENEYLINWALHQKFEQTLADIDARLEVLRK